MSTVNKKAVRRRTKVSRLAEGDSIEYSVSAAIRIPKQGEAWIKVGATSHLAPSETDGEAMTRISTFVHESLEEAIDGITG